MVSAANITGVILAGGAGRRVEHRDKGLIEWQGKPLIAHVTERLRTQVGELLISCNRNFSRYQEFASQIVADRRGDFQGPLAGLEAAASCVKTDYLVVVSCDTPELPPDMVKRLIAALADGDSDPVDISYAHDGVRAQYLCAAIRRDSLLSLSSFLDGGHRAVQDWYKSRQCVPVDFSDKQSSFRNYNRLN